MVGSIVLGRDDLPDAIADALGLKKKDDPSRAVPLAQMMELRSRFASTQNVADFKPGDLCLEKEGFITHKEAANGPLVYMYWADLDLANELHKVFIEEWNSNMQANPFFDCIVGFVPSGETTMVIFRPHTRAHLRRPTAEEAAGLDD